MWVVMVRLSWGRQWCVLGSGNITLGAVELPPLPRLFVFGSVHVVCRLVVHVQDLPMVVSVHLCSMLE